MCADMHIDTCVATCVDMCGGSCFDMRAGMCVDLAMCADTLSPMWWHARVGICVDMRADMSVRVGTTASPAQTGEYSGESATDSTCVNAAGSARPASLPRRDRTERVLFSS